jgi:hypothetical protein
MITTCIYRANPYSGFQNLHTHFCIYCEEEATVHFTKDHYACGNVCAKCARKFKDIEEGIYVTDTDN